LPDGVPRPRRQLAASAVRAALALIALAGLAAQARGDRPRPEADEARGALRDGDHHYQIVIAAGWRPLTPPGGTLIAYAADDGRGHLAITRIETGTRAARDPDDLAGQVQRGVERSTPGFHRVRRKISRSSRGAALDLSYERAGPSGAELVLSRYLFFARHTLVVSIGLPHGASRGERRAAEAMVRSFAPYE
jgi:hypothetical protein